MRTRKPILLAEDDQIDSETVRRAFREIKIPNRLDTVTNGEEALEYLKNGGQDPCMILLDLNMPRMNGIEFLRIMKQDEKFKKIPVVVLTTSRELRDITDSFSLGVAGYVVKPPNYLQFVDSLRTVDRYWTVSELPE